MHVAHAVDGEDMLLLGDRAVGLIEPLGRVLEIIEIGVLRRLDQGEEDALIFLRRKLPLRRHIHEPAAGNQPEQHEDSHRAIIEGPVQTPLIAVLEAFESAIEPAREPAFLA